MGKISKAKIPPDDFQVTTPKNSLLSITSGYKYKEFYRTLLLIPKYQLIVEPLSQYSIGFVSMYCSGNLLVQCTNPNTWLTNDAWIQVRDLHQQFEEDVGCKFLQFINDEDQEAPWLQNPMTQRRSCFFFREQGTRSHFACATAFKISLIYV